MLHNKWIRLIGGLLLLCFLVIVARFIYLYIIWNRPVPPAPSIISPLSLPASSVLLISPSLPTLPNVRATVILTESMVIATSPASTATPVITQTAWLTLTDVEEGYSIGYPANFRWHVLKSKDGRSSINSLSLDLPDVHAQHTMNIQVEPNPNKFSVRTFLKKLYELNNLLDQSSAITEITIKSLIVYRTASFPERNADQTASLAELPDFHILMPYKDKVYRFALLHDATISESAPAATSMWSAQQAQQAAPLRFVPLFLRRQQRLCLN